MVKFGDKVKIILTGEVCKVTYCGQYGIYKGDGYYHLEGKNRTYSEGEVEEIK